LCEAVNIYVLFPFFPHCVFHQVHLRVLQDKSYLRAVEESSKKEKHQSVIQGSSRNRCSLLYVDHSLLNLLGLDNSETCSCAEVSLRWFQMMATRTIMLLGFEDFEALLSLCFQGVFTYEKDHMYFTSAWRKYFVTKCLFAKKWWCEWPGLLANMGWIGWI